MAKLNLSKEQQQMIATVLIVLFGGGYVYWNYLLSPTMTAIQEKQTRYRDLYAKIEEAEKQARRLPALKSELDQLQVELVTLEKQLPTDKDIPSILRMLTKESSTYGVEFVRLAPRQPIRQQYFEIIPFELQVTGGLHNFARFLSSLGQQDRIFQAQNITMSPGGGNPDLLGFVPLTITLLIQTYAYTG